MKLSRYCFEICGGIYGRGIDSLRTVERHETSGGRHIFKMSVALVAEEQQLIVKSDSKIVKAIPLEIANRTRDSVPADHKAGLLR